MQWIADNQPVSEYMLVSTQKSFVLGESPKNGIRLQPFEFMSDFRDDMMNAYLMIILTVANSLKSDA